MAYDRYDTRDPREQRSRWRGEPREERDWDRDRGGHEDRGFFERMGDEVRSWFGDEDDDPRRREHRMRDEDRWNPAERGWGGDPDRDYGRSRHREEERGRFSGPGRDEERERHFGDQMSRPRGERDFGRERDRGYRPITGDYGRSEGFFAAGGAPRGGFGRGGDDRSDYDRSETPWGRDEYRRTSSVGSSRHSPDRSRDFDPHYRSWRDRHVSELDRDYDEYRRENQSRFEDDFSGWRERRMQKRGLLGQIREHMDVVGNDDEPVGTVDRVAGDRIILTKSGPESGEVHHSLSCADIDRVEGDRVILDCSSTEARVRWRDESRSRALFEREDQGEMGPRVLDRSFEGTYR